MWLVQLSFWRDTFVLALFPENQQDCWQEQSMIGSSEASYKPHQPTKKTRLRVNIVCRRLQYGSYHPQVAVEGNIASGKSTLLRKLSQLYDIEVSHEMTVAMALLSCNRY